MFTYCSLGKTFKKYRKTFQDLRIQQIEALKVLKPVESKKDIKSIDGIFPKEMRTNEIKNEIDAIKKWEEKLHLESK